MRFLIDECTGPEVAKWLRIDGHDVFSIYEEARGIDDDEVIKIAFENNRILITDDKGFGEKVFRYSQQHNGVILLRLEDESPHNKKLSLQRLLDNYSDRIAGNFIVVTETKIRIIHMPQN